MRQSISTERDACPVVPAVVPVVPDNAAATGGNTAQNGGTGYGSDSNPNAANQPVTPPAGGGAWTGNPWYGGDSDPANPSPSDQGFDTPTHPGLQEAGEYLLFVLQLVCQDDGRVLSYSWSKPNNGPPEMDGPGVWTPDGNGGFNVPQPQP